MRELIFLTIGNNLPHLRIMDKIRFIFYKLAGIKINGHPMICGPLTIRPIGACSNIEIGRGTFINTETRFGVPEAKISIGANVQIGPRVMFETVNHSLDYVAGVGRQTISQPIVVNDEVWIGAGAIILSGVTIGRGAVVAAGAVVAKDVEACSVVGGVPAKVIKRLDGSIGQVGA